MKLQSFNLIIENKKLLVNILQIFNKIPYPPKDGGSVAVYNFSKGFANSGHHVDLLCLNTDKHFVNIPQVQNYLPENMTLSGVNINTKIRIHHAIKNLVFSKLPYIAERFISEKFKLQLINHLQQKEYDIIQIEGLYMMPYIKTIRNYSKGIISYRTHNIEHEIWQLNLKQEQNFFKKIYLKHLLTRLKKFELSFINTYDTIIPITKRDDKLLTEFGNNKPSHVSPTGIDLTKYNKSEINFSEIRLFHLGSLDWIPNTEGLLWFLQNIWKKLTVQHPDLTFTIAGRNASPGFIKQIRSYKNIIYKGEIENAIDFMHQHNVMIVPLLSGSGMRIKIIEGMAAGNVIITSSKGAQGIDAESGKEILIADNPNEFIQQINYILNHKEKAEQISEAAKQYISVNFDNFAISKSLLSFYSKLLK